MNLAPNGEVCRALCPVLVAVVLFIPSAVSAQKITVDPTRPPVGLGIGAADPERDTGGSIRLQSIVISPTQRVAIINGVRVKLGEKYGDAVLVKVAESEVILKSGATQQVLKIHPEVEKRGVSPVALAVPPDVTGAPREPMAKPRPQGAAQPAPEATAPLR